MADIVTPEVRSRMMSGIRAKNTKPEMLLRKALHARGFRFRLHDRRMPGTPDMVFPRRGAVLFIHGCFWHGHSCSLFKWPGTREEFWRQKIGRNQANDQRAELACEEMRWRVGTVWECALRGRYRRPFDDVVNTISDWLESDNTALVITELPHESATPTSS